MTADPSPVVKKHETPIVPESASKDKEQQQLPWMVYLQGGPGMSCRAPQNYNFTQTILDRGYNLVSKLMVWPLGGVRRKSNLSLTEKFCGAVAW